MCFAGSTAEPVSQWRRHQASSWEPPSAPQHPATGFVNLVLSISASSRFFFFASLSKTRPQVISSWLYAILAQKVSQESSIFQEQYVCMLSPFRYVPLMCDPMDCSPPGSSVHGILQGRIMEWVAISSSRGSSQHWDQTQVSWIAGRLFTIEPPGIMTPSKSESWVSPSY